MTTRSSGRLAVLGGALLLTLHLASQVAGQGVTSKAFTPEQLTKRQFRALPDDARIEVHGSVRTKAEILAETKRLGDEAAAQALKSAPRGPDLAAIQAEVRKKDAAEIAAQNAKVRALAAARKQASGAESAERAAIRRDALDLLKRALTASPAERARIERRAQELLRKLGQ